MASAVALMGVGLPAEQAVQLGFTVATIAGVGTAQSGGAAIGKNTFVNATTSAGQTALVLPSSALIGDVIVVATTTATTALVFPQSGGAIQGGSTDASFSVATNKTAMFIKSSATAWRVILSA